MKKSIIVFLLLINTNLLYSQIYSDQLYTLNTDDMLQNIETSSGVVLSVDGKSIVLEDNLLSGYLILKPQNSAEPFNEGLPSWNGTAPHDSSSFKVQMRFPLSTGWSPWLTVGFWKANIWSNYGSTSYSGGYIDYDNVKLFSYQSSWQFKVIFERKNIKNAPPSLNKLSFFVSDSRTTSSLNYSEIINDNPPQIFIPTDFIYQYAVDPIIGPDICSPTSTSMVLKSYDIEVDPYKFAKDNYDPYFKIFGIWPRAVQNAAQYGLVGAVTRYRNWSDTYDVLANNGRIVMSIGEPLYSGHLIMLAGFTSSGNPIVHDPAKNNGYAYVYNKSSLSHSWFDKGGVAYTLYYTDSIQVGVEKPLLSSHEFQLQQNYPNPFNPSTIISYQLPLDSYVTLKVFDILGRELITLVNEQKPAGNYEVKFDASSVSYKISSGIYFYALSAGDIVITKKMLLMK